MCLGFYIGYQVLEKGIDAVFKNQNAQHLEVLYPGKNKFVNRRCFNKKGK